MIACDCVIKRLFLKGFTMKFLIVLTLLAPMLAFGKTVVFTPIAEDIAATSTGSPGKVIINLINISPDGKKLF